MQTEIKLAPSKEVVAGGVFGERVITTKEMRRPKSTCDVGRDLHMTSMDNGLRHDRTSELNNKTLIIEP